MMASLDNVSIREDIFSTGSKVCSITFGITVIITGLFLVLAAHQILPAGVNAISTLDIGGYALSYGTILFGAFLLLLQIKPSARQITDPSTQKRLEEIQELQKQHHIIHDKSPRRSDGTRFNSDEILKIGCLTRELRMKMAVNLKLHLKQEDRNRALEDCDECIADFCTLYQTGIYTTQDIGETDPVATLVAGEKKSA